MKYLKLVRYPNLILLALMQFVFRYGFLKHQNISLALTDWQYLLLVLSTVLIAAGGYVINDIYDQETDNENKPEQVIIGQKISENLAYYIYTALTTTGVIIGFYLSNSIEKPALTSLFILIAALLYLYANSLKQMLLIGNIIVALLLGVSVLIIGFFDIYPATNELNRNIMAILFSIVLDYAIFAFMINLIREIVKDSEDIEGDKSQDMNTLPIAVGIGTTIKIISVLLVVSLGLLLYYTQKNLMNNELYLAVFYALVTIIAPLIYCIIKIMGAKERHHFHHISLVLKWIIFFGVLSIAVITFNIKQNG